MITRIATLGLVILLGLGFLGLRAQPVEVKEHFCPNCPEKKEMTEKHQMMREPGMMMIEPETSLEMHKLKIKLHKEIAPLRNELEIKELELQALWMEEKLDVEKIIKKSQEIHKIQGQIKEKEIRHQFEIYQTLKPEQQKMFRHRHRMGFGMNWGCERRMEGFGGCCN
ncbi:MAG: hypothetical protein OEZ20_10300 [candidate division WOR-3 bacterium]|nr:hypothetical protein [candidate division WOR-3 bacterium]